MLARDDTKGEASKQRSEVRLVPVPTLRLEPELEHYIEMVRPSDVRPYNGHARRHSTKQIGQIAASIHQFGFISAILIDEDGVVIAGHGRVLAALQLGLEFIPAIRIGHLNDAEKRAYRIADNRLAELAGWDEEILALELHELDGLELDFNIELTGFEGHPLETLLEAKPAVDDALDQVPEMQGPPVTQTGDLWMMGDHRQICGDARVWEVLVRLMMGQLAAMVVADLPYNVAIVGNVGGKGRIARREFAMASGEMSSDQFIQFIEDVFGCVIRVSANGSIHFLFMDWRHMQELLTAGEKIYTEMKNLIVWVKQNAGMGTFYRSQHELIGVYKHGKAPHTNNFGLGETGRHRSNCWSYPGVNSFGAGRDHALGMHPTVKPVSMIIDAIKDVSHRGQIVLDPFGGSGTTLIAAERTGRRARLVEIDPHYCDVACRRWEALTGRAAVLEATGQTFHEVAQERTRLQVEARHVG